LLIEFKALLDNHFTSEQYKLCAHNGKEFDFPFIARRMIIHQISLPKMLNLFGKKPWEIPHLDTLELWKFGDYKHYTSLDLLAAIFDIPSPKEDIDGSQVGKVYWVDNDLDRISRYCERDVWVTAAVYLKLQGLDFPSEDDVVYT
jgi:DNA polymerase elongation subunit (family B)